MASHHPFQSLASTASGLLAANGSTLTLVDLGTGTIASRWSTGSAESATNGETKEDHDEERPKTKQKTAPKGDSTQPKIIKLVVSSDQQHAAVVTDDKFVRVFSVADGKLEELSQRCMLKRPCAIQILPDNATIICGDKFGDVYSLPLLPSEDYQPHAAAGGAQEGTSDPEKGTFKPAATNLTVHTQRNRKALEAQMKQKAISAKKEPLKFEHKLLLGHVSMLTDVTFASRDAYGKDRGYIITTDRDEHIRVSRGPHQAHVIEGYCLGHKEFISKVCLIPGTNFLVSGGGDDWLGVWDWHSCKLHRKIGLTVDSWRRVSTVAGMYNFPGGAGDGPGHHMNLNPVSGMWTVPYHAEKAKGYALVIALERYAGLFVVPCERLHLTTSGAFGLSFIPLDRPPLHVTTVGDGMVVSLDAREADQPRLQVYKLLHAHEHTEKWHVSAERQADLEEKLKCLDEEGANSEVGNRALDDLIYGVASLRKRRGWGGDKADGNEDEDDGEDAIKVPADEETAGD